MFRALQLGKNALGIAAPNPMVGCVIVHEGIIIGEGATSAYGGPHAEVNAIASVRDKSLLANATLYVTLEPCSHYGKTPPCADLIAKHQVKKVVIGLVDPYEKVAGAGIKKLREAGCEVLVGVLEQECREHHKRFLTFQEKKRPYIILKWAETLDGFLAPDPQERTKNPEPYWITNTTSRQMVHQWRSEEMSVLVGTNTALEDNPKLNVRNWSGKNPIRLVLDRSLTIPDSFHLLDGSIQTMVFTETEKNCNVENLSFETIDFKKNIAAQICHILYGHQVNSVLIEGGRQTLQTFIDNHLWDEARIFKGNLCFGKGIAAPKISGNLISTHSIINDTLSIFKHD